MSDKYRIEADENFSQIIPKVIRELNNLTQQTNSSIRAFQNFSQTGEQTEVFFGRFAKSANKSKIVALDLAQSLEKMGKMIDFISSKKIGATFTGNENFGDIFNRITDRSNKDFGKEVYNRGSALGKYASDLATFQKESALETDNFYQIKIDSAAAANEWRNLVEQTRLATQNAKTFSDLKSDIIARSKVQLEQERNIVKAIGDAAKEKIRIEKEAAKIREDVTATRFANERRGTEFREEESRKEELKELREAIVLQNELRQKAEQLGNEWQRIKSETKETNETAATFRKLKDDIIARSRVQLQQEQNILKAISDAAKEKMRIDQEAAKWREEVTATRFADQRRFTEQREASIRQNQLDELRNAIQKRYSTEVKKTTDEVKNQRQRVQELVISWRGAVRLLSISAVYSAMSTVTNEIRQALDTAIELNIAIAQIQTIDTGRSSLVEWQGVLRDLADSFQISIIDQTRAAYTALTSQVINSASEFRRFGEEINKFAAATVATAEDSAVAITGILQAFNLPNELAGDTGAKLFKAIELGRIKTPNLKELGTVAVLANQVGVNLDELLGMYAVLTRKGVNPATSLTQLRGIMIKLVQPTQEMTKLIENLGFTTAEQAISVLGFSEFFRQLQINTAGSTTEIAKHINRIRGLTAAVAFSRAGYTDLQTAIKQISEGTEDYERAVELVMKNTGKQYRIAREQIANFFVVDVASPFIEALSRMTSGFEDIPKAAKVATFAIQTLFIPAITALTIAQVFARNDLAKLKNAWIAIKSPLGLAAIAVGALAGVLVYAAQSAARATENTRLLLTELQKARQENLESINKENAIRVQSAKSAVEEILRLERGRLRDAYREVNKELSSQIETWEKIEEKSKEAFKTIEDSISTTSKNLNNFMNQNISAVDRLNTSIRGLKDTLADDLFALDLEQATTPEQKLSLLDKEIAKERFKAAVASEQGDLEEYERTQTRINSLLATALNINKEFSSQGQSALAQINFQMQQIQAAMSVSNNPQVLEQLRDSYNNLLTQGLQIQQRLLTGTFDEASVRRGAVEEQINQLQRIEEFKEREIRATNEQIKLQKFLGELLSEAKKDLEGFDPDSLFSNSIPKVEDNLEIAKQQLLSAVDMSTFVEAGKIFEIESKKRSDALDQELGSFTQSLDEKLNQLLITSELAKDALIATLDPQDRFYEQMVKEIKETASEEQNLIQKMVEQQKALAVSRREQLRLESQQFVQDMLIRQTELYTNELKQKTEELNELNNKVQDSSDTLISLLTAGLRYKDIPLPFELDTRIQVEKMRKMEGRPSLADTGFFSTDVERILGVTQSAKTLQAILRAQQQRTPENVEKAVNVLTESVEAVKEFEKNRSKIDPDTGAVKSGLNEEQRQILKALTETLEAFKTMDEIAAREEEAALMTENLRLYTEQLDAAAQEAIKMRESQAKYVGATEVFKIAVDEYRQIGQNMLQVLEQYRMSPGERAVRFVRNATGLARGGYATDTVPAMLTPGEFIVNRSSSRRYASQLRQINAGIYPLNNQQQPVSLVNNNNINVNSTGSERIDARRLMREINREQSRGTTRIGSPKRIY